MLVPHNAVKPPESLLYTEYPGSVQASSAISGVARNPPDSRSIPDNFFCHGGIAVNLLGPPPPFFHALLDITFPLSVR